MYKNLVIDVIISYSTVLTLKGELVKYASWWVMFVVSQKHWKTWSIYSNKTVKSFDSIKTNMYHVYTTLSESTMILMLYI